MPPGHDDAATWWRRVNVNICTPSPFSPTHAGDKNADVLRCISTVMTFMMPTGTTSARCQTGPAPHSTGTNGSDGKTHLHFCLIAFGIENQMEKRRAPIPTGGRHGDGVCCSMGNAAQLFPAVYWEERVKWASFSNAPTPFRVFNIMRRFCYGVYQFIIGIFWSEGLSFSWSGKFRH